MNILFVSEVKKICELYKNVLESDNKNNDNYIFDYCKAVRHLNDKICNFHKEGNDYYHLNDKADLQKFVLNGLSIKDDTYLEKVNNSIVYQNTKDFDKIVCICNSDVYGVLSFAKYLEHFNIDIDKAYIIIYNDLSEKGIKEALSREYISFQVVFNKVKEKIESEDTIYFSLEEVM